MASVELKDIRKRFGDSEVLHGIDLHIPEGELTVLVGPSGCGKSTLLRLIAGLETPDGGTIRIGGERVDHLPPARRGIAMVFQSYALYPHMSVFQNMAFGLKLARRRREAIRERVHEAARILQIEHLLERRPAELSGGQRQRVAIGRAIVREPRVFLFDEPLSNLDAALRVQMRLELARLQRELQATMVYVTHDQVEAMTLGQRIAVLNAGRVEQVGAPLELYRRPANRFVAGFIGAPRMNFLPVRVLETDADGTVVSLPGGGTLALPPAGAVLAAGAEATLGVRPEDLTLAGNGAAGALDADIELVEHLGNEVHVHLSTAAGHRLTARAHDGSAADVGKRVRLAVDSAGAHVFDTATGERLAPPTAPRQR